ncbi:hypothetical protein Hanom_Chr06g00572601 [Helianthus anomalus]
MNFALDPKFFDDQYSMSIYEGFFRGAGMLQRVDQLRRINEGLLAELKTSQIVAAEFRCRVTDAERKLLEEKNAEALLEQRERAWGKERIAWMEENKEQIAELKHHKEAASVSGADVETLYTDWGIAMEDKQNLTQERH